jgi:hypothetical protein
MQKEATEQVDKSTVRQNTEVQNAITNSPTAFDGNTALTDQFKEQYNASYGGPNDASDVGSYGDTRHSFEKVGNLVGASQGGYQGAQHLVGQTFKNPSYSRGQKSLDSFILGGGSQGQQALSGIKNSYGTFGSNFTNAESGINDSIKAAQDTTKATYDATRLAVDSKDKEFGTYFDQTEKDATAKTTAQKELYDKAVGGDVEALKQLTGLDEATINGLKAGKYNFANMAKAGTAYGLGDLADQDKVKGYSSLMSLIGKTPTRDFKPVGGTDASFNTTQAELAKQLPGLSNSVQSAISGAKTGQFDVLFADTKGPASPRLVEAQNKALAELGLSREDWRWAKNNGVDLHKLVNERQLTAGDVAGANMTAYSGLAAALGLTPSFAADKGLGVQRTANKATIDAMKQAIALEARFGKKLTAHQSQRTAAAEKARKEAWQNMFGSSLPYGMDRAQAEELFNQYFTRGRDLTTYDITDQSMRDQWGSLMGTLGSTGKVNLNPDSIPMGDAFSFDEAGLRQAISAAMAGGRASTVPNAVYQAPPSAQQAAPTQAPAPAPPPASLTPANADRGVDPITAAKIMVNSNPQINAAKAVWEDPAELTGFDGSDANIKRDIKDIAWSNIKKMVK